ncbi:SDR family NAD(P)-dependent oxidoreductase [Paraburkholderia youngii]|uniref:SDR family NAD(P)-dependent oxidoreductase n=1 Tax=Paraburkholderia youngii TaxID=2782701 RepID=UPI003D191DDB
MVEVKTALITGGAGGIGAATAHTLLRRGWRVAIVDLNTEPAQERANAHPNEMLLIQADVGKPDTATKACDQVVDKWGRLDFLVNCAGVNRHAPLEDFSLEDWNFVLNVNLTSTLLFMQAAARHMLKAGSGAIVNISSIAGARGVPDRCAYAATKAAVNSLTQSGATAWATRGIRVNAVAPGFTKTPLVQVYIDKGNIQLQPMIDRTPMQRMAEPDEIAAAIVFLGSEENSFMTGQTVYVDGGFMAQYGIPSSYKKE